MKILLAVDGSDFSKAAVDENYCSGFPHSTLVHGGR